MKILLLRLEGLLQSWGDHSRWDHRDSADLPTKSGVIGLLGCAMGLPRGDDRLKTLADGLKMAVRADRMGVIMTDFHTVQSRIGSMFTAEGKTKKNGDTLVTPREYLQDACYTVFLTGDEALLLECSEALRHPVWVPCLGRRSCPPSRPILPVMTDEFETFDEAVQAFRWDAPAVVRQNGKMRAEIEDSMGEKELNDQPVDSSAYRYAKRRVRIVYTENGGEAACS